MGLLRARRPRLHATRPAGPAGTRRRDSNLLRPGAPQRREARTGRDATVGAVRYLRVNVAHRVVLDLPEHFLGNFGRLVRHGRSGWQALRRIPPRPGGPGIPMARPARPGPGAASRTRSPALRAPARTERLSAGAARALQDAPSRAAAKGERRRAGCQITLPSASAVACSLGSKGTPLLAPETGGLWPPLLHE